MDSIILCEDCGWTGKLEDCVEGYTECPKCGSENLIELIGKSPILQPVPV